MTIYDDFQGLTTELMGEFKQGSVILVAVAPGTGPADNPGNPTETEYLLKATVKGVSFKYVRQGLAVETDLIVTSAVLSTVTPDKNSFVKIDGVKHKIVQDVSVPAAGTKVAWKFIVRKGG